MSDERKSITVLKKELTLVGKQLVGAGLSAGSSGNISVLADSRILMSPTGVPLDQLEPDQLAEVSFSGEYLAGARPSKEVWLHLAIFSRNPDAKVIVHVHSPAAVGMSCMPPWKSNCAIPPYAPYLIMRVGQVPLLPYATPGSRELGDAAAQCPIPFRAALMAHHGLVCWGETASQAVEGAIEVEEASRLALDLVGTPATPLDEETVRELAVDTPWTP